MTQFEWYIVAAFAAGVVIPLIGMYFMMRSSVKTLGTKAIVNEYVTLNWSTGGLERQALSDVVNYVHNRMGVDAAHVMANAFTKLDIETIYHWIYVQYYKAESFTELTDTELFDAVDTLRLFCDTECVK